MNILLVDDRPENLLILENILDDPRFNLVTATSGNEALACVLETDFFLILMDVHMPGMDGFEAAAIIKQNDKFSQIPIIFITAIIKEEQYVLKGYKCGAVDYLCKPIIPEILRCKVNIFLQLQQQKELIEQANRQLEKLSLRDALTGLPNRRNLDLHLDKIWRQSIREQSSLSLIMADIDYFKNFNDNYGHQAGDTCLQQVADILRVFYHRPHDLFARYGGEEFVGILPNTDHTGASFVAETMRNEIQNSRILHGFSPIAPHLTLSLGVATVFPTRDSSAETLLKAADNLLYQAKDKGRNRVEGINLDQAD